MQRIAITGGVAEGKTTVLRIFESLGAQVISSDQLAATLLAPGTEVSAETDDSAAGTETDAAND